MSQPLDDFSTLDVEANLVSQRKRIYVGYAFFVFLLINSCAYMQWREVIDFTPVFGQYPGQLASLTLLFRTIFCYKNVLQVGWKNAILFGTLLLLVAFTIAFQIGLLFKNDHAVFPFWIIISVGYVFFSVGIMEFFVRRTFFSKKKNIIAK